jgi:hypothetical protein
VTPRERIARLEGLLDRVQTNASRPRAHHAAPAAKAPAPAAVAPPVAPTPPAPPVAAAPTPAPTPPAPHVAVAPTASSVPPWKPEPSSTVQARPATLPPEELSDDDLIDVTTIPPEAPAAAAPNIPVADELPVVNEEEEPPASSRRSKVVAESLDQAIASAAAHADEREVPIHTPPPESGPQEAVLPAGIEAPRAPAFEEEEMVRPVSLGPTTEQLGETIELDEAEGPEIEIEVAGLAPPEAEPERPVEELEVTLPRAEMPSGMYDVSVSMPAQEAPVVSATPTAPAAANMAPDITSRPQILDADVAHVVRISEKAPENFAELIDGSLGL